MKVAVYYNNRDVRVEERPLPRLEPGDLLVQTAACGLCGGETMEWYLAPRAPKILGHEPTGVVVETGPGPARFKVGDRVFAHHHVACMACHDCSRGFYTLCEHYGRTNLDPGGFAEYFRVPAENARLDTHRLPDHVSFEAGTVIEPVACTLKGLRVAGIQPGDTVAIVGLGFMGQAYLQLTRLWQAGRIVALDFSDWRLAKARAFGATHTLNPKTTPAAEALRELNGGRLADVVIVTAPSAPAWEMALGLCDKGATFHVGAPPAPEARVTVNPNDLYFREIRLNSTYSATQADTRAVLDLLAAGRLDAEGLITHRFGLEGVPQAIDLILQAGASLKSVIYPGGLPAAQPAP